MQASTQREVLGRDRRIGLTGGHDAGRPGWLLGRGSRSWQKRFPNEQGAMAVLNFVATSRKDRETLTGMANGWQAISNTPVVHEGDRIADYVR